MGWSLDEIPWTLFDRTKVDPELVPIVKAAALVEYNGAAYAHHLCRVFADDPHFQERARHWGEDEIRHGRALAQWAQLADPGFDFTAAVARFRTGYRIDFDRARSRRGSRAGEMIARCIVETGTSAYYSALRDAAREPVLREVCRRIAADEVHHYKLFHRTLIDCQSAEPIALWRRLAVAVGRLAETADDELACAFWAANEPGQPYARRRCRRAYARRVISVYRQPHVDRGVRMIFKAVGLAHNGRGARVAGRLAWFALSRRARRLARIAA
jgi:hypothetical protein